MCEQNYDITCSDLNPQFLYSCIQTKREPTSYHSHDFIELVVVLKGKGYYVIDDREYPVSEGDLLILNPGTWHKSFPDPDSEQENVACHLAFSDVEFKDCPKGSLPLFKENSLIAHMPEDLKGTIFYLCAAIDRESSHREAGRFFMMKAYLIQILCLIERFRQQELNAKLPSKNHSTAGYEFKSIGKKYIIQNIMKYMEENYREKISLDQIAANMYLSSYYISKLFKSETGDTPINYLIGLRMKKAREILEDHPDYSVQAVAAAVGYDDAYHFSKLFKKYYGLSPLYYKSRLPH